MCHAGNSKGWDIPVVGRAEIAIERVFRYASLTRAFGFVDSAGIYVVLSTRKALNAE